MKQAILIFIICSLIALALPFTAQAAFSLVPCGRSDQQPPAGANPENYPHASCTLQHFFVLIIRAVNYLLSMAGVVAIYFVLNAGFGLVFAMGKPENIQTNKDAIQHAVVGLGIVFTAFVFVNLLVNGIFGTSISSRKWWDPGCIYDLTNTATDCPVVKFGGVAPPPVTPPPGPPPDVGTIAGLAQAILDAAPRITLSTSADCGAPNHARGAIDAMAASQYPPVCSSTCTASGTGCVSGGTSGTVTVNPEILTGLLTIPAVDSFTITSLTTGRHSANSTHYTGEAVDIVPSSSSRADWMRIRDFLDSLGGNAICENIANSTDVANCNAAQVNHIHWSLRGAVGGLCEGSVCSDTSVNICAPVMPLDGCFESRVNAYNTQITAGAGGASAQICTGVNTVKLLKSIMANESDGGQDLTSFDNSSFGLFHMKPSTADTPAFKTACSVSGTVDRAWLLDTANAEKQACLAAEYLKTLVFSCGCDARQIAAAYNGGAGACLASRDCGTAGVGGACAMCPGQARQTRRWECLWDNLSHTQCNAAGPGNGYAQTRIYAPAVEACYARF